MAPNTGYTQKGFEDTPLQTLELELARMCDNKVLPTIWRGNRRTKSTARVSLLVADAYHVLGRFAWPIDTEGWRSITEKAIIKLVELRQLSSDRIKEVVTAAEASEGAPVPEVVHEPPDPVLAGFSPPPMQDYRTARVLDVATSMALQDRHEKTESVDQVKQTLRNLCSEHLAVGLHYDATTNELRLTIPGSKTL